MDPSADPPFVALPLVCIGLYVVVGMVALQAKVDPHRSTIEVPEGDFRIYREDDRFMVGRIPDGSLLGYFQLDILDNGRVGVRANVTGQLGLGSLDEARELLDTIGRLAVEHGLATV